MAKKIIKLDQETSMEMQEAIASSSNGADSNEEQQLDISDAGIDSGKYLLHALITKNGNPAGTTNLTPSKIKALSRMKILNYFYKCDAVDQYRDDIINLRQSMTEHPDSLLNLAGNLFRGVMPLNNQPGTLSRMGAFLRGRQ